MIDGLPHFVIILTIFRKRYDGFEQNNVSLFETYSVKRVKLDVTALENKRKKLSRGYDLTSEFRMQTNGHYAAEERLSKLEYMRKAIEYQFLPHYFGDVPDWRKLLRRFNGKRTLPDFCIAGPMKSGTCDLAINLMLHPNVMTPLSKEILKCDPEDWRIYYPTESQKKKHILRHGSAFSPLVCPFMHWRELTYNLSLIQPNTKIVLVLRDPARRVYSHWKWELLWTDKNRANECQYLTPFSAYVDEAIKKFRKEPIYTACGVYPLETSIYWNAVSYWLERFGRQNVLVLDVGDYFLDPNRFFGEIFEFVGLPHFVYPTFDKPINENPLLAPPPDQASLSKLNAFFKPHNDKLWNLIGKKFDW